MLHEGNKVIDEKRQGEALMLEVAAPLNGKKLFLESYGCAMNFSDSEIVASILTGNGFETTKDYKTADVIFINTCAIRDQAETRVRTRLQDFKKLKKQNPSLIVGVLGCMAERLKSKFLEEELLVDIVAGPDAYRDLPNLIEQVEGGQKAVNVLLSREETYADISPVRLGTNGIIAYVSIMRGCDNMCSFCVVPFTRGRERSRDPESIIAECKKLFEDGYREVTLLGQNVDSYLWWGGGQKKDLDEALVHAALNHQLRSEEQKRFTTFADLLELVAGVHPDLLVRFSTSNPRDMTDAVLHSIAKHENICKYVHLPVQSGSTSMLERMNRGYTREQYMDRIAAIRRIIPNCGISTDTISGFCGETEEEHQETISLMKWAGYHFSFMFKYSERPGTAAAKKYVDDIPEEVKGRRLQDIVDLQQVLSANRSADAMGRTYKVLVEGFSKKSKEMYSGRNTHGTVVVFPCGDLKPGDCADVLITRVTVATLIGEVVKKYPKTNFQFTV